MSESLIHHVMNFLAYVLKTSTISHGINGRIMIFRNGVRECGYEWKDSMYLLMVYMNVDMKALIYDIS
jgi:hypothetical protein